VSPHLGAGCLGFGLRLRSVPGGREIGLVILHRAVVALGTVGSKLRWKCFGCCSNCVSDEALHHCLSDATKVRFVVCQFLIDEEDHMLSTFVEGQPLQVCEKLPEHFQAHLGAVLQQRLHHKVPILVHAETLHLLFALVTQVGHQVLLSGWHKTLDETLKHPTSKTMPSHVLRAHCLELLDDGGERRLWEDFDNLCQHIVTMWRLPEIVCVTDELVHQHGLLGPQVEEPLDHPAAGLRSRRELRCVLQDPVEDLVRLLSITQLSELVHEDLAKILVGDEVVVSPRRLRQPSLEACAFAALLHGHELLGD